METLRNRLGLRKVQLLFHITDFGLNYSESVISTLHALVILLCLDVLSIILTKATTWLTRDDTNFQAHFSIPHRMQNI